MGDFERTVREFKRTLTGGRQKTSPLDIMGKVTRVEDGVAWVRFAGSEVGDTPVRMNIDCKEGDIVQVRSSDGKAWIVGNQSAPPTDDSKAKEVEQKTEKFAERIKSVEKVAGDAADVANAVNQKVWSDEAGLHIADGKQDAAATRNTIWNSLGMLFRKGLNPILGILTGDNPRVAIYDGQGSGESHEVASFGESARMGKKESSHVSVESNRIVAEDGVDDGMYGVKYFDVGLTESASIVSMTQNWTISEQVTGRIFELSYYPVNLNSVKVNGSTAPFEQSVDNPKQIYIPNTFGVGDEVEISYTTYGANSYFTFGQRLPGAKIGDTSFASGNNVVASGRAAHAEGIQTVASALASHAEGYKTTARYSYAHAEGANTTAKDYATHAEGQNTTAFGYGAHSEGQNTTADFESAHAEGKGTYAGYGSGAHAEGAGTTAKGIASHAEGKGTIAHEGSHVEGSYNVEDTSDEYAHIIGNGTSDSDRSNALAVDWDGNTKVQGNYYANCSSNSEGTAYIGQVFNWQGNLKSNLTANADAYVEGNGSITLKGGHTYLVLAYVAMTNSTNGTVDRRAQIFNKTTDAAVLTGSKFVASQSWGTVETQTIYEANADVTLTVRGSASRPTTTTPTAWIRAVCIA